MATYRYYFTSRLLLNTAADSRFKYKNIWWCQLRKDTVKILRADSSEEMLCVGAESEYLFINFLTQLNPKDIYYIHSLRKGRDHKVVVNLLPLSSASALLELESSWREHLQMLSPRVDHCYKY